MVSTETGLLRSLRLLSPRLDATAKWYQLKPNLLHCCWLFKTDWMPLPSRINWNDSQLRVKLSYTRDWMPLPSGINWNTIAHSELGFFSKDWMPLPSGINWNTASGTHTLVSLDWMPLPSGINWNSFYRNIIWSFIIIGCHCQVVSTETPPPFLPPNINHDWMPLPSGINWNKMERK